MAATEEIARQSFFRDLTPAQAERLAACATTVRYAAGQSIFHEGEPATRFFLLTQGRVELQTFAPARGPVPIATIHAGDALGWSWLFPPYAWHFDALALEPIEAISFDAPCLRELCEADHDLGYTVLHRMASVIMQRLQSTRLQMLDVYGTSAPAPRRSK